MKKTARLAALGLLLSFLTLSGCVTMVNQQGDQAVSLPEPPDERMQAPYMDTVPVRDVDAVIYLTTPERTTLVPVERKIHVEYTQDPAKLLLELLQGADEQGLISPIPAGCRLLNIEHTGNVVTVDLSVDAYDVASAREILLMDAAIARTLGSLEEVEYVNVLIGGRKYAIDGMSMGALKAKDDDLLMLWAHTRTEAEYIANGGGYLLNRTAVTYYPAVMGGAMRPVAREIEYTPGQEADKLIEMLSVLPDGAEGVQAAFLFVPEYTANTIVTEDGRRVLKIDFAADTWAAISGGNPGMTCAAAALTLTSFIPELDGVVFCDEGMLITEYDLDGDILRPQTGILTREALRSHIGTAVSLHYAVPEADKLVRVTRTLSPMVEHYPRMLLSLLMESSDGVQSAVPEGITIEDIPGIMLSDDIMQVNLSANFYRLCQKLDEGAERRLVYAIVNTLCDMDGVNAVQFFVEGEQVDVLAGAVYIRAPLLPNPGLVHTMADNEEETE